MAVIFQLLGEIDCAPNKAAVERSQREICTFCMAGCSHIHVWITKPRLTNYLHQIRCKKFAGATVIRVFFHYLGFSRVVAAVAQNVLDVASASAIRAIASKTVCGELKMASHTFL